RARASEPSTGAVEAARAFASTAMVTTATTRATTARATATATARSTIAGVAARRAYARKVKVGANGKTRVKIKPYSSYKGRFQVTASGKILRKRKGKRHCAFAKTPKQRMRLRSSTLVHETLLQPMRKLGFKLR
ncbi:50S ribosomal protein L35, partial [bacterium]|nr:50S ribosomal protein L35 [bacterium]MDA9766648.1 50S ribosomal protein L35 [bacterium]